MICHSTLSCFDLHCYTLLLHSSALIILLHILDSGRIAIHVRVNIALAVFVIMPSVLMVNIGTFNNDAMMYRIQVWGLEIVGMMRGTMRLLLTPFGGMAEALKNKKHHQS